MYVHTRVIDLDDWRIGQEKEDIAAAADLMGRGGPGSTKTCDYPLCSCFTCLLHCLGRPEEDAYQVLRGTHKKPSYRGSAQATTNFTEGSTYKSPEVC